MKTEVLVVNGKEVRFETVEDGKAMISSREIAEHFEKRHDLVLRVIKRNSKYEEFLREGKIKAVNCLDKKGEKRPMHLLDIDAVIHLVEALPGRGEFLKALYGFKGRLCVFKGMKEEKKSLLENLQIC